MKSDFRFNKIYVEITNICNLHCSFCHGTKRKNKSLTEEEFRQVLNKIKGYTKYVYFHLMGEPLLCKNLGKFLDIAKEMEFKVCLTTNGTLLMSKSNVLIPSLDSIHKISISLQAQEANEELDLNKDMDNCGYAQDVYISENSNLDKDMDNNITASEANVSSDVELNKYMDNCIQFVKLAEGKTIISLRLWNEGGRNQNNGAILNILRKAFPKEWIEHPLGYTIGNKVFLEFGDNFEWPDLNANETKQDRYFCMGLKDHIGILSDGTVVPCCLDSDGNISLGNIFEQNLEEIINSQRALNILNGFQCGKASEDLCKKCGYASRFVK